MTVICPRCGIVTNVYHWVEVTIDVFESRPMTICSDCVNKIRRFLDGECVEG